MPKTLPENATPASRRLYDLAQRLAAACPPTFASEIALVGSASMGLSDDQSDLDINFWADTIPPEAERVAWLQSLGVTDVKVGAIRQEDRSYPCSGVLDGVEVGCSWQSFTSLYFFIELITTAGENEYHMLASRLYTFTSVLVQAIPVRTSGVLDRIQAQLAHYPDSVRSREIRESISPRSQTTLLKGLQKALRYGDELMLIGWIESGLSEVIKLLYPINRMWYPQDKWRYKLAAVLPLKPDNLYERVGLALHDPDKSQRPLHLARLLRDTLALVEAEYDVYDAVNTLETFIRDHE